MPDSICSRCGAHCVGTLTFNITVLVLFAAISLFYLTVLKAPPIWLALAIVVFALYFLPTIVAEYREHANSSAIFVLNILLGWTFIGWVIALVWAYTDNSKTKDLQLKTD